MAASNGVLGSLRIFRIVRIPAAFRLRTPALRAGKHQAARTACISAWADPYLLSTSAELVLHQI
jgi:hypothetical protein